MRAALVVLLLAAWTALASADTKRVAVVVGNNVGNGSQAPLRYAEIDADKVGRVLVELGGVAADDLFLLRGKDLATLETTLRRAKERVATYQRGGLDRVVVIFYYSGHSDGAALELGRERFTFAQLRVWLRETGAEVRVGLVDSCKSGALLAVKGGTPGPAFQIRLTDELASAGEVLLTSSAADEDALESKEIGGSFFTHHLVSGLRGAADASGDARVTLAEAYHYAYKHTIATSGATLAGPQHPAYDYRLTGQGELVLTELAKPTAALALPAGYDRALVIEIARDQVIAELGRDAPAHVAVTPGRYGVRAWKGKQAYEGRVAVVANSVRAVRWDELRETAIVTSSAKGGGPQGVLFGGAFGAVNANASELDALYALRLSVRRPGVTGPFVALDLGTQADARMRESALFAFAGYRVGLSGRRFQVWAGGEVGAGMVIQSLATTSSTGALAVAPLAGISAAITPTLAIALETHAPATLVKRAGELDLVWLPAAWLGVHLKR